MLTLKELRRCLRYVKSTGKFYWRVSPKPGVNVGDEAGCLNWKGYVLIGLHGNIYRAHRLAWFWVYGVWPVSQIDHRNTLKSDNRWSNLREASNKFNHENQIKAPSSNKSCGLLGVTWDKRSLCWKAQIKSHGMNHYLGQFKTAKQAHRAYVKAKRRLHAGCTI